MSRTLLLFSALALSWAAASPARRSAASEPSAPDSLSDLPGEKDSLNEILREVEDLMKDSQSKLENAVNEMRAEEISTDRVALKDLPPNYHNETIKETKIGNDSIVIKEEINKETDNNTGTTYLSRTIVSSLQSGDKREHECIVDEDCALGGYCHLSELVYKCLPCKEQEACTRDGECCGNQLCIWGECKTSQKGESGAICEKQSDCGPGLCCAVHSSLFFPVCTPLLVKGEECQNPNSILDIFSWDPETDAPQNRCPCAGGLICQPQSDSLALVCEDFVQQNKREESLELPYFTTVPEEEEMMMTYDDAVISPTGLNADLTSPEDEGDARFVTEHQLDYI